LPRITIDIESLDRFACEHCINSIRLWKLDIEGGEYEALLGAEELLSSGAIEAILLECSPKNYNDVEALLNKYGYGIWKLNRKGPVAVSSRDRSLMDFVVLKTTM